MKKIGVIGAGAMGSAMAGVLCETVDPSEVLIYDVCREKTEEFAAKTACCIAVDELEIARDCEIILLAIKPQILEDLMSKIIPVLKTNHDAGIRQIFTSIAAGWTIDQLDKIFTGNNISDMPVIRILPNIPIKVKEGVILFTGNKYAGDDIIKKVMDLYKTGGLCVQCEEELFVNSIAVFSCSPAMVYMFIESIADAGVQIGMDRKQATQFAAQAVKGSASMVLNSGKHIGQLKEELDTPGGMTIGGTNLMEQTGFRGSVIAGVLKAHERQFELK